LVETIVRAQIPLPVPVVFSHISMLENMNEYNSSVRKSARVGRTSDGFPIYTIDIDLGFRAFQGEYIVREWIVNQKIVASCKQKDFQFTDTYTFRPEGKGTFLEIADQTELKGLLSMSEFLLGPIMKSHMHQNLNTLLKILERKYSEKWIRYS